MAGRRQHYIPQFLQRGFLGDPRQEAERTWLHRRGAKARLVGIRDVGVREHFYSKLSADGAATLDDLITAMEHSFGAALTTIRQAPVGTLLDPKSAARLTAHLTLRTAHIRSVFQQGVTQLFDQLDDLFADPGRLREVLGLDGADDGTIEIIDEVLREIPLGELVPPPFARRLTAFLVRESFDEYYEKSKPAISLAFAMLGKGLATVTRDGHNKALMTADQGSWEEELSQLTWRTYSVVGAIFPDCVALVQDAAGVFTPLVLREHGQMEIVILPIAHDRLLVGSKHPKIDIAVESINRASASCSDNFFISHEARDEEKLSDLIGQRCAQVISAVFDTVLLKSSHFNPMHKQEVAVAETRVLDTVASGVFSFSLTCLDFADADTVASLCRILQGIVQEMGRSMPLDRLDGITFAVDYSSALETVDRGDPALGVEESQPRSYGRPIAKCLRVVRAGQNKEHIVFEAGVAMGLLASDEETRAFALHMIICMLADVAYGALYKVPLEDLPRVTVDCVTSRLHSGAASAPSRYFAARASAFSDPSAGERYAELMVDSLASALDSIREARLAYRLNNDVNRLLDIAVLHVSFVLAHAAEWLGHRDGLPEQDLFPGSSLPDDLKPHSLHLWLELFGRDLRRLHDVNGQFTSMNIFALAKHVERLLWMAQICPWPTQEGDLYVSVPMGEDERLLAARSQQG